MPNITTNTLNWVPGVNQAAMTQPLGSNECGAYAILGAVGAFGAFQQPANLSYANAGPQVIDNAVIIDTTNNNYHQLSTLIYRITGILNDAMPAHVGQAVNPELLEAGNVYNSPAAMAKVAMDLGRNALQINVQAAGFGLLNTLYPGEQVRCVGVVGADHVDTDAGDYAAPGADQTTVVCVDNGGGGFHWVAQGSDGNFYDPGNGSTNNTWAPTTFGSVMGDYTFTGLWMVIS